MRQRITDKVVASAAALLASGVWGVAAADAELDSRRSAWQASGTQDYLYAYQKFCECHRDVPPETFVEVTDGTVTAVYHVHADSDRRVPAREGSLDLYWTIPDLFSLVAAAESRGVPYRVEYADARGYPTRVYIDYDVEAVGEEIDIRLTSFEAKD